MPAVEIPGYVAGTWDIGPVYSHLDFVGRHIVVGKVRGRFEKFEGQIVTTEDLTTGRGPASVTIVGDRSLPGLMARRSCRAC
jgi:polyisoprenoid-binding protein YceI